jgi:SAM-dependent methyltransferase
MDDVARFNKERWEELAQRGVMYSRPKLHLDEASARETVDPEGRMDESAGRDVLCLAGGGGQQSAAFCLLGAKVTVLDLCETQLRRDREAAAHYGHEVRTVQGDMRDLSCFEDDSFDIIYHAHSLNFVPQAERVFDEVVRVLRPGGQYRMSCWNPLAHGACETIWREGGYVLRGPYVEGLEIRYDDPCWELDAPSGSTFVAPGGEADGQPAPKIRIPGPREFRHTLEAIVNGMIERGLAILGLWEQDPGDPAAEPGTWDHFKTYAPPWLTVWTRLAR